jgi:hypothetical protein
MRVLLRAAETGELAREDLARIVAIRYDLKDGDRLQLDQGQLFREQARPPIDPGPGVTANGPPVRLPRRDL